MGNNIILIGMSGAGKSTLGVLLAKALGLDFVDTDLIIQQQEGRLLQEIIDADGVEAFMEVEERVVSSLDFDRSVVATGGSVVYSPVIMDRLKPQGRTVYLHVSFPQLKKRLRNVDSRGIVFRNGNSLEEVYAERLPLYDRYADLTVDCDGRSIEECVDEIVSRLG